MAVKVIEYGRRRIRCPECLSMLEFEKNNIKTVQTGMNEYEKVIECPNCEAQIVVKER